MRTKRWICLMGMIIIFGMIFGIFAGSEPELVLAAEQKNLYALEITTGMTGTKAEDIQAIVVSYKDSNNNDRVYSIFPAKALKDTMEILDMSFGKDEMYRTEADKRTKALRSCEETLDLSIMEREFIPYTTQSLFFTPYYDDIASLQSIKIITTGSSSWNIQGMRLIKVDRSTVAQVGNASVSSYMQPGYTGIRLAEMNGIQDMAWTSANLYELGTVETNHGAYFETKNDNYSAYDSSRDDYILKLDIADEYKAGLEALATESNGKTDIHEMKAADLLFVSLYYEDIYGDIRIAKMPVISNVIAEMVGKDAQIIGLAQQGESLAFHCRFPGIKKIITDKSKADNGIRVTVGMEKSREDYNIFLNSSKLVSYTAFGRSTEARKNTDSIAITNIGLYSGSLVSLENTVLGGELVPELKAKNEGGDIVPEYYYSYKKYSGRVVSYGQTQAIVLQDNTVVRNKMPKVERELSNLYLVELNTASMSKAATVNDLKIQVAYRTLGSAQAVGSTVSGN